MKSPFQSFTIVGAFASIVLKALGFGLNSSEAGVIVDAYQAFIETLPLFIGLFADFKTISIRFKDTAEIVDRKFYQKKSFWAALVALIASTLSQDALVHFDNLVSKLEVAWISFSAISANLIALYGTIKSRKAIIPVK